MLHLIGSNCDRLSGCLKYRNHLQQKKMLQRLLPNGHHQPTRRKRRWCRHRAQKSPQPPLGFPYAPDIVRTIRSIRCACNIARSRPRRPQAQQRRRPFRNKSRSARNSVHPLCSEYCPHYPDDPLCVEYCLLLPRTTTTNTEQTPSPMPLCSQYCSSHPNDPLCWEHCPVTTTTTSASTQAEHVPLCTQFCPHQPGHPLCLEYCTAPGNILFLQRLAKGVWGIGIVFRLGAGARWSSVSDSLQWR